MLKRVGLVITLMFMASVSAAETGHKPLTKQDIGKLFSLGELKIAKIIFQKTDGISQLERTGVIIQTIEPDYVIILGDQQRLEQVRKMGFTLAEPVEADHKQRKFQVLIHNSDELLRLRTIASDVWPDHWPVDTKFPLYVRGRAYDSEFKWAKEAGLNMELCHSDSCDKINSSILGGNMKTLMGAFGVAAILAGSFIQPAWADDYRTYDQVRTELFNLSQANPSIAKYFSKIGTTIEGRDIPAIKITKNPQADDPNKPDVLFLGGHHAREWIGIEVPLRLAEYLVANYSGNDTVKSLVDSREIWIIPIVNPDGYIYSHTTYRLWRKNRRSLGAGVYGVDLNRNYDWLFGQFTSGGAVSNIPSDFTYHGSNAFSEPETKTIKDFIESRESANNPISRFIDYHSFSQLILYPWGDTKDQAPDAALFKHIAEEMRDRIKSVHGVQYTSQQSCDLYPTSGTVVDWAYGEKGILAFTIELRPADIPGSTQFKLPIDQIVPTFEENLPAALYFIGLARGRLMDFEDGADRAAIRSAIPGMKFTTTQGV